MIICERFVYIHMPKTGGTFVRRVLRRLLAGRNLPFIEDHENKHGGVEQIPARHRHVPILATIRNPFDHYVSYYEFGWWKNHANDTFDDVKMRKRFPSYPEICFHDYIHSIYDWSMLSDDYMTSDIRSKVERAGIGPLTTDYIRYFSDASAASLACIDSLSSTQIGRGFVVSEFLHTERLNEHLHRCLVALGFTHDELAFILGLGRLLPPGGASRRTRDWTRYYTSDLKRLVRYRERMLFGIFPHFDQSTEPPAAGWIRRPR